MDEFRARSQLRLDIDMKLTESEARALLDIIGYGTDEFLRFFYSTLGTAYLKRNEAGLKTLFTKIKEQLPPILHKADKARELFSESKGD